MAEQKEKKNRIAEVMNHEWKYENLILVVLALFAIELGVLLLTKHLTISSSAPIIGEYWKVFAWVLVGMGTLSLLLAASSFYRPSFGEIKHITGLSRKEFLINIVVVVVFSLILAFLFVGYDALIEAFIKGVLKR